MDQNEERGPSHPQMASVSPAAVKNSPARNCTAERREGDLCLSEILYLDALDAGMVDDKCEPPLNSYPLG